MPEPINDGDTVVGLAEKYPKYFKDIPAKALKDKENWHCNKEEKTKDVKYESQKLSDLNLTAPLDKDATVEEISKKYPNLFKDIPSDVLKDQENWKVKIESTWYDNNTSPLKGYFINVGAGKGLYALDDDNNGTGADSWNSWVSFAPDNEDSLKNQWIYCEELPSEGTYFSLKNKCGEENFKNRLNSMDFSESDLIGGYIKSVDLSYGSKLRLYNTYTFSYNNTLTYFEYKYTYQKKEVYNVYKYSDEVYKFEFWGIESTDVLKRSLFVFDTQEECDDFNIKVIAVTPSEINEIAKRDTPDTLDLVERADMFYIASYKSGSSGIDSVLNIYNTYFAKDSETVNKENLKSFTENDLEWASCYKILVRMCNNPNLPLMLNPDLGTMLKNGVKGNGETVTHMNITDGHSHVDREGSLNNLSKLYLLSLQFNMLARLDDTSDGIAYERTFYDNILPNLKTIKLDENTMKGADKGTATTTGYYERE